MPLEILFGVVLPLTPPPGIKSLRTLMLLPRADSLAVTLLVVDNFGRTDVVLFVAGADADVAGFGTCCCCAFLAAAAAAFFCAFLASFSESDSDSSELELLESLESLPLELEFAPLLLLCRD